jgi:microcin C transport system ATP-binding protein
VLVEQGSVAEVFANPQHPYTQKLLNSRPRRDPQALNAPRAAGLAGPSPLQAHNLGVAYPVTKPGVRGWFSKGQSVALQGASFALQPGQTLGVVGESGSGKSTLALAALDLIAFSGDMRVAGAPWARNATENRRQRSRVQVVFQDPFSSLSPRMTVEQIMGEGLDVHAPGLLPAQRRERVLAALASVGLVSEGVEGAPAAHAVLQRYPHEFSGGQRQRLAIARALIVEPAVLVLDEPTSALDVTVQQQVLTLLQRLQRERHLSYLLITHDMDVIQAMAHDVMVLKGGAVVESGPVQTLLENPKHPYTMGLLTAAGLANA